MCSRFSGGAPPPPPTPPAQPSHLPTWTSTFSASIVSPTIAVLPSIFLEAPPKTPTTVLKKQTKKTPHAVVSSQKWSFSAKVVSSLPKPIWRLCASQPWRITAEPYVPVRGQERLLHCWLIGSLRHRLEQQSRSAMCLLIYPFRERATSTQSGVGQALLKRSSGVPITDVLCSPESNAKL